MTSSAQTVVNTVNTVGVMGKGLAASFKKRHPDMFKIYKDICKRGELSPGSFWLWKGPEQWVLNFATKKHWRNPSKFEYVRDGLQEFRNKYEALGIREIAFPRLGCGNGGLDWNEVKPLMVDFLRGLPITVYVHDFEKPLQRMEHEISQLPLISKYEPGSFEEFCDDLRVLIDSRKGRVRTLKSPWPFLVRLTDSRELRGAGDCDKVLATEDDLFRIWSMLMDIPVSRFDLPETAQENALKVLSVIAELPYARPINLASKSGRNNLAVEFMKRDLPTLVCAKNP